MRTGPWIPLGRIGGVPLRLDPVLPLLLVLLAWSGLVLPDLVHALLVLVALVGFVVLHELGHALAARRRGLAVSGIHLHLLPVTYVEAGRPQDVWRVALAGPALNLLVGLPLLALRLALGPAPSGPIDLLTGDPLGFAAGVNVLMGTLNLAPVLPADGGRALRALVTIARGPVVARVLLALLGALAGVGLSAAALLLLPGVEGLWLHVLALYVLVLAAQEAFAAARAGSAATP